MRRLADFLHFYAQRPYLYGLALMTLVVLIVPTTPGVKIFSILVALFISVIVTLIDYLRLRRAEMRDHSSAGTDSEPQRPPLRSRRTR
jgi:hypothetical protein